MKWTMKYSGPLDLSDFFSPVAGSALSANSSSSQLPCLGDLSFPYCFANDNWCSLPIDLRISDDAKWHSSHFALTSSDDRWIISDYF